MTHHPSITSVSRRIVYERRRRRRAGVCCNGGLILVGRSCIHASFFISVYSTSLLHCQFSGLPLCHNSVHIHLHALLIVPRKPPPDENEHNRAQGGQYTHWDCPGGISHSAVGCVKSAWSRQRARRAWRTRRAWRACAVGYGDAVERMVVSLQLSRFSPRLGTEVCRFGRRSQVPAR